jgi:hypothetical protein
MNSKWWNRDHGHSPFPKWFAQQTLLNHGVHYLHAELAGKFFTSLGEAKACHHPAPPQSTLSLHVEVRIYLIALINVSKNEL